MSVIPRGSEYQPFFVGASRARPHRFSARHIDGFVQSMDLYKLVVPIFMHAYDTTYRRLNIIGVCMYIYIYTWLVWFAVLTYCLVHPHKMLASPNHQRRANRPRDRYATVQSRNALASSDLRQHGPRAETQKPPRDQVQWDE